MCGALRRPLAIDPIALVLAHATGLVRARERSTPRCPQKPLHAAGLRLVVDAIVLEGGAPRLAVPDSDRARGLGLEHHLADSVTDQICDTTSRTRSSFPQCVELFLAQVNLGLLHICHFSAVSDIRQSSKCWHARVQA